MRQIGLSMDTKPAIERYLRFNGFCFDEDHYYLVTYTTWWFGFVRKKYKLVAVLSHGYKVYETTKALEDAYIN